MRPGTGTTQRWPRERVRHEHHARVGRRGLLAEEDPVPELPHAMLAHQLESPVAPVTDVSDLLFGQRGSFRAVREAVEIRPQFGPRVGGSVEPHARVPELAVVNVVRLVPRFALMRPIFAFGAGLCGSVRGLPPYPAKEQKKNLNMRTNAVHSSSQMRRAGALRSPGPRARRSRIHVASCSQTRGRFLDG